MNEIETLREKLTKAEDLLREIEGDLEFTVEYLVKIRPQSRAEDAYHTTALADLRDDLKNIQEFFNA